MQRHADWLRQAEAELRAARTLLAGGDWGWCCFTCQQVGEKALKALAEWRRLPRSGHDLTTLATALDVAPELLAACQRLDRYYIPTRYPDAFARGAPADHFARDDAEKAIGDAEAILESARDALGSS